MLRRFAYDAFKPRDAGAHSVRRQPVDVAYLLKNGASYLMDDDDKKLCALVDGRRTLGEIIRASGLEPKHGRERHARQVDRGIVLAPRESAEAPPASVAPAGTASSTAA